MDNLNPISPSLKYLSQITHFLFCLLLIGLPFSKALVSIAFVGLILVSIFSFFQNRSSLHFSNKLLLLPSILFFSLAISLFYSNNFTKGLDVLLSQIEFLAIPFIFWVNHSLITKRFQYCIQLLIGATTIAAFITFGFFLLPVDLTQYIAATIPLLKDYIIHEKALAFGVYSPFTERLQFSYLIGVAIFLQLWVFFEMFGSKCRSSPHPPPETGVIGSTYLQFLLVRTCSPQPILARLWRVLRHFTLARGEKNKGFGQNVLTSNHSILEPITPAPEGEKDRANIYSGIRKKNNYLLSLLKIMILFSTLLILGARGAQLSFLVASMIWIIGGYFYFIHPKLCRKINAFFAYASLIIGLIFFLIIAPFFAYQKIPTVKVRYDQMRWEIGTFQDGTFKNYEYIHFTSIRRLLSWKNSWSIVQANPILGVGIGDYQTAMEKEYAKDELGFPVNTQSQFLYYWAASGLINLLIFISLLGYTFITFIRHQNFTLKLLGCSFIVFYSLVFLFDAPLNFQVGAMTFLTIFCLLVSKISQQSNNPINSLSS